MNIKMLPGVERRVEFSEDFLTENMKKSELKNTITKTQ